MNLCQGGIFSRGRRRSLKTAALEVNCRLLFQLLRLTEASCWPGKRNASNGCINTSLLPYESTAVRASGQSDHLRSRRRAAEWASLFQSLGPVYRTFCRHRDEVAAAAMLSGPSEHCPLVTSPDVWLTGRVNLKNGSWTCKTPLGPSNYPSRPRAVGHDYVELLTGSAFALLVYCCALRVV